MPANTCCKEAECKTYDMESEKGSTDARQLRSSESGAPSVYLAGPEVFLSDVESRRVSESKKAICANHGFEGRFPLDEGTTNEAIIRLGSEAMAIFEVCVAMMKDCDLMIANLTPFRGSSMDVGTAVEIGFMFGLEKPVFGYTNSSAYYYDRVRASVTGGHVVLREGETVRISSWSTTSCA